MPVTLGIIFNDGNVDFGSSAVTIGGVSYLAENISPSGDVNVVDIPNAVGAASKQVGVSQKIVGSMTLQLETTNSAIPARGGEFTLPARYSASGSAVVCYLTSVGTPRSVNDYAKVECGFVQKLN